MFGTATDVTLSELASGSFLPGDAAMQNHIATLPGLSVQVMDLETMQ